MQIWRFLTTTVISFISMGNFHFIKCNCTPPVRKVGMKRFFLSHGTKRIFSFPLFLPGGAVELHRGKFAKRIFFQKPFPKSRKDFSDLRQVGFCAFGLKTTSLNSTLRHKNQLVFSLKSPFYFSEMAFEKVCA